MSWDISDNEIKIIFYYNDEHVNVDFLSYSLNKTVDTTPALLQRGWQPNFRLVISKPEPWITDYFKIVKFVMRKYFFFVITLVCFSELRNKQFSAIC